MLEIFTGCCGGSQKTSEEGRGSTINLRKEVVKGAMVAAEYWRVRRRDWNIVGAVCAIING